MNLHAKTIALKAECDRLRENKEHITQDVKDTTESLFKQIRRALNYADNRCTKIRQGKIPYSRKIRKALGTVMTLQVIQARILLKGRRSRPHTKEQSRIIKKFGYDGPVHFDTLEEATKALHLAHKEYNKL